MALKTHKPFTPSSRYKVWPAYDEITESKPEKSLCEPLKKTGGRNNQGRITCRHMGGGHKRKYRLIDFKRKRHGDAAKVLTIEYDPNRTSRIALIQYADGQKSYILAPVGLEVGMSVVAGEKAPPKVGNALPLKSIPLGTSIHNIELTPGRGAQIARSAGQQATLTNRETKYALIRMPSGELRKINKECYATIGQVGNTDHMKVVSGKAGRTRWLGVRPTVRGMAMNPIDHPNGGGEGRSKSGGGRQHLKDPSARLVKGQRSRRKHKPSDKFIVSRRKAKGRSR